MESEVTLRQSLTDLKSSLDLGFTYPSPEIKIPLQKLFPLTDDESESPLPIADLIYDQPWFWNLLFDIAVEAENIWYRTLVKAVLVHAHPEGLVDYKSGQVNWGDRAGNLRDLADAVRAKYAGNYLLFVKIVEHFAETRRRKQVSIIEELMLEARELAGDKVVQSIENLFSFEPNRFLEHLRRLHYQAALIDSNDYCRILHSKIGEICTIDLSINAYDLWHEISSVNPEYVSTVHREFVRFSNDQNVIGKWFGFKEYLQVSVDNPTMSREIEVGLDVTNWLDDKSVLEQLSFFKNNSDNSYYGGLCRFSQIRILREMMQAWGNSKSAFLESVKGRTHTYCPIHQTSSKLALEFVNSFLIEDALNPDTFAMNRFATQRFLALSRESKEFNISEKAWGFLTRNGATPLLEWQEAALISWVAHGRQGLLSAATGTGKSRLGIAAILEAYEDGLPIVLLTHRLAIKGQWKKDELMSIFDSDISGYKVSTEDRYFTLGKNVIELSSEDHYNHENPPKARPGVVLIALDQSLAARTHLLPSFQKPGLLVADEVHQFNDPTGSKILNGEFSRRLGMSATISGYEDYGLLPKFGGVKVADYGLSKAIRDKVICDYNLVLIRVPYVPVRGFGGYLQKVDLSQKISSQNTTITQDELHAAEVKVAELLGKLTDPVTGIPYESDESFDEALDRVILAKHPEYMKLAKIYLRERSNYDRLAKNFTSQLSVLELLQGRIKEHGKTLVFSNTKAQGKEFRDELMQLGVSTTYIDSDTEQSGRNDAFKALEKDLTKALISPQILDEGINIPSAQIGMFLGSGNGKYRQVVQRMGRVLRKKKDSREALIVLAVGMYTREDPGINGDRVYPDSQFGIMQKDAKGWKIVNYEDAIALDTALNSFLSFD